jgi:hypothetical protein
MCGAVLVSDQGAADMRAKNDAAASKHHPFYRAQRSGSANAAADVRDCNAAVHATSAARASSARDAFCALSGQMSQVFTNVLAALGLCLGSCPSQHNHFSLSTSARKNHVELRDAYIYIYMYTYAHMRTAPNHVHGQAADRLQQTSKRH